MSGLWPNARTIGRCGRLNGPAAIRMTPPVFLRNAATAAKPRAQKAASSVGEDTATVGKKALNTKTWVSTAAKTPRKKAEPPTTTVSTSKPTATTSAKNARSAPTKTTTPAVKKAPVRVEVKAEAVPTTAGKTATELPTAPPVSPPAPPIGAWKPTAKPKEVAPVVKKPADVNSPEYKAAARKWTALMVALPILFVTSYYLYDRLALGNGPGLMDPAPTPPPPKDKTVNP